MHRIGVVCLVVFGGSFASRAFADCGPVGKAMDLLVPGARIIVGEIHGTNETPRVVGDLVCLAAKKSAVRLGVEMSIDEQAAIDRYLASGGSAADRRALFEGKWMSGFQDGTRSTAMAELIELVRRHRHAGADVGIVAFSNSKTQQGDRDVAMAENLLASFARSPKAVFVVLTGNVHAQRKGGQLKQSFMTAEMIARGARVTALDSRYGMGSSWACWAPPGATGPIDRKQVRCGPAVIGEGTGKPPGIVLQPKQDGAYDGVLDVGAASFSPPAAIPMSPDQAKAASLTARRIDARRSYEAKASSRCGELYAALAAEQRSAEDAYNAACCYALAGSPDRAFELLGRAVEFGFNDGKGLEQDGDLVSLHRDSRWKALVSRVNVVK